MQFEKQYLKDILDEIKVNDNIMYRESLDTPFL